MQKLIQLAIITLLCTQLAVAQERQIKLLNPDGTPATDATAIAIMTIGQLAPIVNENLELKAEVPHARAEEWPASGLDPFADDTKKPSTPQPPLTDRRSSVKTAPNNNGTISFDENAHAIVARSDQGFVFIPKAAFTDKATLRSWAKLKIDIRTIPREIGDSATVEVVWTNCFGGRFPPGTADGLVIDPSIKKDRIEDWRIDPFVRWTHHAGIPLAGSEVTSFEVQVPPGEVSVGLIDTSRKIATDARSLNRSGHMAMLFSLWKTRSGSTTDVAFSAYGSVKGKLVNSSQDLPDWNQQHSGQQSAVMAVPTDLSDLASASQGHLVIAQLFPKFARFLNVLPNNPWEDPDSPSRDEIDKYAKYLATDEGFQMRKVPEGSEAPVEEDGSFYFPALEVGEYAFVLRLPISQVEANDSPKPPIQSIWLVKSDDEGHGNAAHVEVKDQEITDLGEVDVDSRERSRDGRKRQQSVPRIVARSLLEATAPADDAPPYQPALPAADYDLNPATTSDDFPTHVSQPDADPAAVIVQQWLKSAAENADRTELKKMLTEHLEKEFDASQQSRRTEIERLLQLLGQSKEWLDKRQERRDEIVLKRIEELLKRTE